MVLVNDRNRYAVILYDLRAKDFKNFSRIIVDAIRRVFQEEGIKDEVIDSYLAQSPHVRFTKTINRSLVARMNSACSNARFELRHPPTRQGLQVEATMHLNKLSVGSGNDAFEPNLALYDDLRTLTGQTDIFKGMAVVLKVTLKLENHEIWRRIAVPMYYTFKRLHGVLQVAFDWKDYHLYDFHIFDEDSKTIPGYELAHYNHAGYLPGGLQASLSLVDFELVFEHADKNIPTASVDEVRLEDCVDDAKLWVYVYDFGDFWRHIIEIEAIIDDYEYNYPVCLEGMGTAPPEDVGGETGFDEFVRIMADKQHPEHEAAVEWSRGQLYREFDIDFVNRRLEYS